MSERLKEELEAVESILVEGLEVIDHEEDEVQVEVQLHPLTGCEEDKKYVSLLLQLIFSAQYPDEEPKIKIKNPRGLSDNSIEQLGSCLKSKCQEFLGEPVIFELIDMCREFLTECNVPACSCAICLYGITDDDAFHKTSCYHYFHCFCLGRYVKSMIEQHKEFIESTPAIPGLNENRDLVLTCPVCRETLDDIRLEVWNRSPSPKLDKDKVETFKRSKELLKLQENMQKLFRKQKAQGSIIDDEEDGKKFLVSTAASSAASSAEMAGEKSLEEVKTGSTFDKNTSQSSKKVEFKTSHKNSTGHLGPEEGDLDEEKKQQTRGKGQLRGRGRGRGRHRHHYVNEKATRKAQEARKSSDI